jgi:kinesin family member 2/24
VEEEMAILKEVDKPGSDVENYVMKLDKVLIKKIDMMNDLRRQLLDFYKNIKTEEQMAKLFHEMQVPSENSLEDLNTPNQ